MTLKNEIEKNVSSFDLIWEQAFQEMDAWVERANQSEVALLQSARQFAESVARNQKNMKELSEKFTSELREWEKTSREEILTATAGFQYIFPLKSYEEINSQLDQLQDQASALSFSTFSSLINGEQAYNFVTALEQYVEFKQKNREQYVRNIKETASIIQENQKAFLKIMTNQMKNIIFPFNKYLEIGNPQ